MKILYVNGRSIVKGIEDALYMLHVDFEIYPKRQMRAFVDETEVDELIQYIRKHAITHIMSIHLIDNLAEAAEITGRIYISMIWDAPYFKLFSHYGRKECCWFSTFDKIDCQRFIEGQIQHVLYQPLAVNDVEIEEWDKDEMVDISEKYLHEICFVGNLYENNFYDEFCRTIPQIMQDYFTAVFEKAAFRWDGVNRIYGTVSDEMITYMKRTTLEFQMINLFEIPDTLLFENGFLVRKIANIERICVLNLLAEEHSVTLYTTSKTAKESLNHVHIMPPVSAGREAHNVFKRSKINLNISLKGIEGGTPQRIMDIMGAGGFVLTNYCPETAELFEEDKEIVMFKTPEELLEKVNFYLEHEKEREQIAQAGHEKVMKCYTYKKKLKTLLEWVGQK